MTNLERKTREFREWLALRARRAIAVPTTLLASEPVAIRPAVIEPAAIEPAASAPVAADFRKLGKVSRRLGGSQNDGFQPLVLESMTSLCESLNRDPFLSRTKAGEEKIILGGAEGIALASRVTALDAAGGSGIPVRRARRAVRAIVIFLIALSLAAN